MGDRKPDLQTYRVTVDGVEFEQVDELEFTRRGEVREVQGPAPRAVLVGDRYYVGEVPYVTFEEAVRAVRRMDLFEVDAVSPDNLVPVSLPRGNRHDRRAARAMERKKARRAGARTR